MCTFWVYEKAGIDRGDEKTELLTRRHGDTENGGNRGNGEKIKRKLR
jgi:hypothetical protein